MSPRVALAFSLVVATSALAEPPNDRVLERYRQMLAANPVEGTALDRLWKAYSESGHTGQLIAEYEKGAAFADKMILGHLQHRAGRDSEAVAGFTAAAGLEPASALPLLALAGLRHGAEAAPLLEQALARLPEKDPRVAPTLDALGRAWLEAGDRERASAAWERTVALDPTNMDLRRRLAETYRQYRLPERALPHLQYVAEHAPASERAAAYEEISHQHQALRQPAEAIRALEQAVALTATGSWLWSDLQGQLIRLHQRFGRSAELEEKWKHQAAANPRDLGALLQLVELYQRLGDLEQERASLEKLTALAPKNLAYRWRLARLLVDLDRRPEAAALYDSLLAAQPGNIDAAFERAKLDIQAGLPEQARTRITTLLQAKKADDSIRGRALDFYQQHRMWREAEEVLRMETGDPEEGIFALANFDFARHREAEGEATLRRLVPAQGPPRQRAAALVRVAQVLKSQNLLPAAARALAEAVPLAQDDPKQLRELSLQLGEAQAALGDHAAARLTFLEAVRTSRTPGELEESEQRLFDTLRQLGESTSQGRRSPAPRRPPVAGEEVSLAKANPWIGHYIDDLTQEAQASPSEQAWLRVARWRAWCQEPDAAMEDITRALAVNPQSIPAHEAAVKLSLGGTAPVAARWHLEALQMQDAANASAYRRRLALLDLQTGQVAEAIRGLAQLVQEAPGNLDLLMDLANAQQRAERWEDALATWQSVLATGSAARRRDAVGPLLRIYERLRRPEPAAELLLSEFEARSEPKEQLETFKELLTLCQREGLLGWLHERWAARREGRFEDATGEIAWAQLLKAEGDAAGAFAALSDALFTAPNPADALPELVRQAEELRRLDAAIDFQSRLVRLGAQNRPEALIKLAELQERDFALEPAARTWALVVSRFPRDANALLGASEFHLRAGENAAAALLLHRVRELEPADTRALFSLARLDLRVGDLAEAEACLEQILRVAPTDHSARQIRFPAMKPESSTTLQATYLKGVRQRRGQPTAETMRALRGFWVEAASDNKTEDDLRLSTLRELGGLVRAKEDPVLLERWIARWHGAAEEDPGEALWALFYAQAGPATLDLVEGLLTREPGNVQYQQGFIWMALQLRQFTRLATWMYARERTPAERDFVRIALSQYLQSTAGSMDPELLQALTPPEGRGRLWELAQLCAGSSCYAEAVQLGRRAYAAEKMNRSTRGWEIAQWELALGHPEEAQRLLAEVARLPGETYESPSYAALRAAYLLLPPAERPAYAERVESELAGAQALHATMVRLLLRGLGGDEAGAREEVRRLAHMRVLAPLGPDDLRDSLAGRSTAAERSWDFIRGAGQQWQGWGLDSLAEALWTEALADPALIRLQGDAVQEAARDVRLRLLALRVAHAGRDEVSGLLEQSERGPQALDPGTGLGEALETMRALPRSLEVYYRLWQRDPANGQILRSLLNTCRVADDTGTAETALQVCVSQRLYALNDNVHRDLVMQLADLLERRDALEEARQTVARALESSAYDTRLLLRLAQLTERTGDLVQAEALWRRLLATDPSHAAGKLGLAELLVKTGRRGEAIALLQKGTSPGVETRLAELLYAEGQVDAALTVVERVSGTDRLTAPRALATAMLAKGDRLPARALLQAAVSRTLDPAAAMQLQSQLIECLTLPADRALVSRELWKLRQIAGDDPGRLGIYFSFLQTHAAALGLLDQAQRELTAAWADGTGLLSAGLVLLSSQLETAPAKAEAIFDQIMARRDVSETWLQGMLPGLTKAARPDLAARVELRLLRLAPGNFEVLLSAVQHLVAAGQPEKGRATMQAFGSRGLLEEALAQPAAAAWVALGQPERARELLGTIAPPRGVLHGFEPFLEHARLRLAAGDLGPAKALLLRAFEHPGNRAYGRVVDWLTAAGRLDRWETELVEFRFTPPAWLDVKRAVFTTYAALPTAEKVLGLVDAHPELLDAPRCEALRAVAQRTGAFGETVAILERTLQQSTDPASTLTYALTLADWSDTEPAETALSHLNTAQSRRPDLFLLAEKLYTLHRKRGEPTEAKAAVLRYLTAAAKDAPDRAKAAALLK